MKKSNPWIAAIILALILIFLALNWLAVRRLGNDRNREAEAKAGLHEIQHAIERYAIDREGEYPPYLIGGDIEYAADYDPGADNPSLTGLTRIQDLSRVSDPLLREGYLESYPYNPFVKSGLAIAALQIDVDDPLRNDADGPVQGCRFGGNCRKMGNVMPDHRFTMFQATLQDGSTADIESQADFQHYPFYDVWEDSKPETYIPGEFFYKSNGPITATDPNAIDSDQPIQQMRVDQYIMGVYGSLRSKGMDVLGPARFNVMDFDGNESEMDMPSLAWVTEIPEEIEGRARSFDDKSEDSADAEGEDAKALFERYERLLNGGNPFCFSELGNPIGPPGELGNPNGIPDGIILVVTSWD